MRSTNSGNRCSRRTALATCGATKATDVGLDLECAVPIGGHGQGDGGVDGDVHRALFFARESLCAPEVADHIGRNTYFVVGVAYAACSTDVGCRPASRRPTCAATSRSSSGQQPPHCEPAPHLSATDWAHDAPDARAAPTVRSETARQEQTIIGDHVRCPLPCSQTHGDKDNMVHCRMAY